MKSGFVSILGRTNVGKSSIINSLVGEKVAAIANKPQTTRTVIRAIVNRPNSQIIFIDTPGIHKPKSKLGNVMVDNAFEVSRDVDVVVFVVEATSDDIGKGDKLILEKIKQANKKTILVINKVDLVDKAKVAKLIELYKDEYDITFDDENEFKLLIETINDKEKIVEKDDFIDINSSILNINKFVNSTNDDELAFKVIDEINSNIVSYKKYLSINDVLDILIYSRKYIDIINEVKKQQALKEKERILNGCFEEEKKINNNLLDYSNITNGYDFEAFVANVYKMLGYNVEGVTSKSGDQGADVIIEKDNIKYAIQVKYYNNPVGNKAIQEVVAAKSFYKTDKAMVVTNSTFTPQAITLANVNDVLLVDGNKLDELIKEVKNK